MTHSRKKVELAPGQRFGKLTILGPADNKDGRTAWRCRCDCGNEVVIKTYHLRNGHTQSCGCIKENGLDLHYVDGTCVEMLKAKTIRKNNTSGVPGVEWLEGKKRWRATIGFKGKRHYLGSYHTFEEAVKARKEAESKLHDQFLQDFTEEAKLVGR